MAYSLRGYWYRWQKKRTVDDLLQLDMKEMAKEVDFDQPGTGTITWTKSNVSIMIVVRPGRGLQIRDMHQGEDIDPYFVPVVYTTPNYGGRRPWFLCPNAKCRRRIRILYGGKHFLCRHCHNLTYRICQKSKHDAMVMAIRNRLLAIRLKLHANGNLKDPLPSWKPRYMHTLTYERLVGEYYELAELEEIAVLQNVAKLVNMESSVMFDAHSEWRSHNYVRKHNPDIFRKRFALLTNDQRNRSEPEEDENNRLTLGELANLAEVPYAFAMEVKAEDLIRPDNGRGKWRKRYRRRLATWLIKLHSLREAGQTWENIRAWTRRRWEPGHEHERIWPTYLSLQPD